MCFFFYIRRRPPRSTRTTHTFPTRRSSDLVVAALVWLLGLKPALNTIEQSREQLPRLHADAAQVDALILEAQALQRGQTGKIDATDILQAQIGRAHV